MKKLLLSVCAIVVATATFAQSRMVEMPNESLTKGYSTISSSTPTFIPSTGSVAPAAIWEDDCSSASTWVFTNTSTQNFDWEIEMNPGATPAGGALTPMASATASNGYMMISSDMNGGPDNNGTYIICEFTNATPIDLTMYPNIQLTFQHNFRWWHDTRVVRISPDNGATWVDLDEISNDATYSYPNQSSDNPHMSTYDISAVAGGQSQVLVQFYYNDNDIWAWYWAVDDIAISVLPDNHIVSSDEVTGGWWIGYQSTTGLGQDYTFNPISQATANPYAFESVLRNGGIATQEVTMYADVLGPTGPVIPHVSNTITLAAAEQDTVAATTTFTPPVTGAYSVDMWAVADSGGFGITMTSTPSVIKTTTVTDYSYGKDQDVVEGSWRLSRNAGGFEVAAAYDIYANANLYSIDVNITDWSVPGANVYAMLYEYDPAGGDPIYLDQSDDYTISATDPDGWINIPFLNTQSLITGTTYMIAIGGYQHPTDTAGINVSGLGEASVDQINDKAGVFSDPVGTPGWYNISDIPMLRMNFDPATGWTSTAVNDVNPSQFNVYPNPTNGVVTIELNDNAKYDVTVNNVLGQTVYTTSTTAMNTTIDLSNSEKGIYTIELNNSKTTYTEKVIVE